MFRRYDALHYTGSNGADIAEMLNLWAPSGPGNQDNPWVVLTEVDGELELLNTQFDSVISMSAGQYMLVDSHLDVGMEICTEEVMNDRYVNPADYVANLLPPPEPPAIALGVASVPSLLGNTQVTVPVTIKPTLASTSYTPVAVLLGSSATLSVVSTTAVSESQVDVVVQNTGLLTIAGGSVLVAAVSQ
jgi:hypothetical protein